MPSLVITSRSPGRIGNILRRQWLPVSGSRRCRRPAAPTTGPGHRPGVLATRSAVTLPTPAQLSVSGLKIDARQRHRRASGDRQDAVAELDEHLERSRPGARSTSTPQAAASAAAARGRDRPARRTARRSPSMSTAIGRSPQTLLAGPRARPPSPIRSVPSQPCSAMARNPFPHLDDRSLARARTPRSSGPSAGGRRAGPVPSPRPVE